MSLHLWCCQGPHKPGSCANFMLNSHWGRAATGKKKSCAYAHRVASVVSNSLRPCRLAYLEKEMATHSSILAWRIPGTEEPSGLLSMGSHRVRHN